ncbi:MAG: alpha-galactosidase, partial [Verrucomicrobia bacterium]|nr:alpha-galactosidase [Verrucomicrobiota bacterium]
MELLSTFSSGRIQLDSPGKWLVTPLMEDAPAEAFSAMQRTSREAAMVYNAKGTGFLIGPTGPPEAFTEIEFKDGGMKASAKMEGVLVKAGQSRRGEPMVVCFDSPDTATKIWSRWVAATHGARLHRERVYGWCSWYSRTTNIDEKHTRDVLGILADNPNVFGKSVLQLDDGYQIMDGDWRGNAKFPSGLAKLAKDIRAKGWLPGVWFAPLMLNPEHPFNKAHPDGIQKNAQGIASFMNPNSFHPDGANWLVPDHPESRKFLHNTIKEACDSGYGYIKIDFNGIGSQFTDPTKTSLQIFRELYALYREAAGEEIYMLSCLGQPTRGVIGYVDAARVGPDAHPGHFDKCLKSVLRFQIYNNVWWHNDPDCSYLAPKLESRKVGYTHQGEGMWKTWHNIVTLVGGTAMNSEPLDAEDCKAVWRNSEIMRPSSA